jgi:hypothetical protein
MLYQATWHDVYIIQDDLDTIHCPNKVHMTKEQYEEQREKNQRDWNRITKNTSTSAVLHNPTIEEIRDMARSKNK